MLTVTGPFTTEFRRFCRQDVPDAVRIYPVVSSNGIARTVTMQRVLDCRNDPNDPTQLVLSEAGLRLYYEGNCADRFAIFFDPPPGQGISALTVCGINQLFDANLTDAEIVALIESFDEDMLPFPFQFN